MQSLWNLFFIGDTIPSNNMRSCHATFHSSLTVQSYAMQLSIITYETAALGVYPVLISEDLVGSELITWLNI